MGYLVLTFAGFANLVGNGVGFSVSLAVGKFVRDFEMFQWNLK